MSNREMSYSWTSIGQDWKNWIPFFKIKCAVTSKCCGWRHESPMGTSQYTPHFATNELKGHNVWVFDTRHVKVQGIMAPSRRRQRAITSDQAGDIGIGHKILEYLHEGRYIYIYIHINIPMLYIVYVYVLLQFHILVLHTLVLVHKHSHTYIYIYLFKYTRGDVIYMCVTDCKQLCWLSPQHCMGKQIDTPIALDLSMLCKGTYITWNDVHCTQLKVEAQFESLTSVP